MTTPEPSALVLARLEAVEGKLRDLSDRHRAFTAALVAYLSTPTPGGLAELHRLAEGH